MYVTMHLHTPFILVIILKAAAALMRSNEDSILFYFCFYLFSKMSVEF